MRVVLQRVTSASVHVRGEVVAQIGVGFLLLVGIGRSERQGEAGRLAEKIAGLRVFEDDEGRTNRSLSDVDGEILLVPQFTLYGDVRKGKRPSWDGAAPPEEARLAIEAFATALIEHGAVVQQGAFQEHMEVSLVNDGPLTLVLESG